MENGGLKMNCKDCIHYVICTADAYFKHKEDIEKDCCHFREKVSLIELPNLKYMQEVYLIYENKLKKLKVTSFTVRPEFNNLVQINLYGNSFNWGCIAEDIGETVFLTKEEALNALEALND